MDPLTKARIGLNQKQVKQDTSPQDRERENQTKAFLESPVWKTAKTELREGYISALQRCPVGDDMQRYRLVAAINIIDMVETHIKKVHSDAEFNLKQVQKDFAGKRGLFR